MATIANIDQQPPSDTQLLTRRGLVQMAGVTLVGTVFLASGASALSGAVAPQFPAVETGPVAPTTVAGVPVGTLDGGTKPIFVAPPGNQDPVAHSVADTLFWGDIMMEHAMFFVMLMPGPDLAQPRREAEQFQRRFSDHLARLRRSRLDRGNYASFNRGTRDLLATYIDYKRRMQEAQTSGRYRTLVWPSFFDHTRKEAERFSHRLQQLDRGDASFSRAEVVPFWADKMQEHSLFIAHLLDPDEKALKGAAEASSEDFARLEAAPGGGDRDTAMAAAQTIINFKTAAEKGIQAGTIKSIIHPALADHVRREAVRFKDELTRAG